MSKGVSVVFGATGGIGSALSRRLVKEGYTVYLAGRSEEKLKALSLEISAPYITLDIFDEKALEDLFYDIMQKESQIDAVISCIGSFYIKPLHLTTLKDFEEVMRVNTTSSFCILKAASHVMAEKKTGSIVLCSSVAALAGLASHEAISAAKGAITALVRSSAASLASKGVRVNAVAPGLTKTPLSLPLTSNEAMLKGSIAFHPMGRIGEPEDIASAIYFLISSESSWVTGQVLPVDGGLVTLRTKSTV